jgi:signal transduction histidine kinase
VEAIHAEAMRCKQIVQEMLTYARPRPIGLSAVEPRSLNDEVLSFVFPRNRQERYQLIREYAENPGLLMADPNLLKQALLNLYLNAQQAIPDGELGKITARIARFGRWVRFEVEDNGTGIAEEDLDHIFNPFFTRKPTGTGLGLAVTQRIVEQFEGSITVRPAVPRGTVFCIDFPRMEEA